MYLSTDLYAQIYNMNLNLNLDMYLYCGNLGKTLVCILSNATGGTHFGLCNLHISFLLKYLSGLEKNHNLYRVDFKSMKQRDPIYKEKYTKRFDLEKKWI